MRLLFTLVTAVFLGNIAAAATVGDDGLHIQPWIRDTFKDLQEDLDEANAEGKRLAIFFEQRGCIYCTKMHETVYPDPELSNYIDENFFVIQLNLHGDLEVVDFDGDTLTEKQIARKWGILFTPSVIFLPEEVEEGKTAIQSAVAMMPGAFGRGTTLDMFTWVNEKRYALDSDEDFQRYHARRINERRAAKE
jgi:thioredoxin-related protein